MVLIEQRKSETLNTFTKEESKSFDCRKNEIQRRWLKSQPVNYLREIQTNKEQELKNDKSEIEIEIQRDTLNSWNWKMLVIAPTRMNDKLAEGIKKISL